MEQTMAIRNQRDKDDCRRCDVTNSSYRCLTDDIYDVHNDEDVLFFLGEELKKELKEDSEEEMFSDVDEQEGYDDWNVRDILDIYNRVGQKDSYWLEMSYY